LERYVPGGSSPSEMHACQSVYDVGALQPLPYNNVHSPCAFYHKCAVPTSQYQMVYGVEQPPLTSLCYLYKEYTEHNNSPHVQLSLMDHGSSILQSLLPIMQLFCQSIQIACLSFLGVVPG
jgi:hypothetical protein